jgi:hypothetical protein
MYAPFDRRVSSAHQEARNRKTASSIRRFSFSAGDLASEFPFRASSGLAAQAPWHLQKPGCWGSLTANPLLMHFYYRRKQNENQSRNEFQPSVGALPPEDTISPMSPAFGTRPPVLPHPWPNLLIMVFDLGLDSRCCCPERVLVGVNPVTRRQGKFELAQS